jgi:hypothetical protein
MSKSYSAFKKYTACAFLTHSIFQSEWPFFQIIMYPKVNDHTFHKIVNLKVDYFICHSCILVHVYISP